MGDLLQICDIIDITAALVGDDHDQPLGVAQDGRRCCEKGAAGEKGIMLKGGDGKAAAAACFGQIGILPQQQGAVAGEIGHARSQIGLRKGGPGGFGVQNLAKIGLLDDTALLPVTTVAQEGGMGLLTGLGGEGEIALHKKAIGKDLL